MAALPTAPGSRIIERSLYNTSETAELILRDHGDDPMKHVGCEDCGRVVRLSWDGDGVSVCADCEMKRPWFVPEGH